MIKKYDNKLYCEMADKANEMKQKLYILETEQEFEKQIFEYEKKEIEVQKYDEEGNPMYDEDGNPIMETILVDDFDKPIIVEEIDQETGETILVHKYHIEKYLEIVAELVIAEDGYYICFDGNSTDGTINHDFEEYKHKKIGLLKCTKRVFALLLQKFGISYSKLKELIATNEQAQLEWDLCVELLRANPMLDLMAQQLGLSPIQLDKLFLYANGEITLEEFEENE